MFSAPGSASGCTTTANAVFVAAVESARGRHSSAGLHDPTPPAAPQSFLPAAAATAAAAAASVLRTKASSPETPPCVFLGGLELCSFGI